MQVVVIAENMVHCGAVVLGLIWLGYVQLVATAASTPAQDQEAQQASAQELQMLKESLNHSENRSRELEGQLETINRVRTLHGLFLLKIQHIH